MVCNNRGIYWFLGTSWVLITYIICPPVKKMVLTRGCSNHDKRLRVHRSSIYESPLPDMVRVAVKQ